MSEFGSSKSFSSVSESSASHSSQPPDSSSSHSSGGPSSSSDEVHTCHRCGDCCFSDKSRVRVRLTLPEAFYVYNWEGNCLDAMEGIISVPLQIALGSIETDVEAEYSGIFGGGPTWIYSNGNPLPESADDPPRFGLWVRRDCITGRWFVRYEWDLWHPFFNAVVFAYLDVVLGAPRETCSGTGREEVVPPAGHCCGVAGTVALTFASEGDSPPEAESIGQINVEMLNNPCCWDTIGVGCFQHFGGDCRGNCDEEPSSGSSASSSEENPLP